MKTENFEKLIQLVTGRKFTIKTSDIDIEFEKEYYVFRKLPITGITASFKWKSPKADEKILRSFITAFTTKYREPNPESYNYTYGGTKYTWNEKTEEQKENCYYHHAAYMYSKEKLLQQVEDNFSKDEITSGLLKYGFYNTEYGIGIFCFWMTTGVQAAIKTMSEHLNKLSIPFTNEFSDAKWVYRFKLGLTKTAHLNIINELSL